MRIAVDFPAPFGPRNQKMIPSGKASESPASAVVLPYSFQTSFRTIGSAASGIYPSDTGQQGKVPRYLAHGETLPEKRVHKILDTTSDSGPQQLDRRSLCEPSA